MEQMWLWFISDLMKTTIKSAASFTNAGLDSGFMGCHKCQKKTTCSVHQTTVVYKCSQQSKTMPEFWWSELLCSYFVGESQNTSIGFFLSLLRWGKQTFWGQKRWRVWSRWRWNISQQQTELRTCTTLELWLHPGWSKGHSSNRKWHGEGAQEVRGRALVFLFVHSHSLTRRGSVLGQGRMEGGNGEQSQPMNWTKQSKTLTHHLHIGPKLQTVAGAEIRLFLSDIL